MFGFVKHSFASLTALSAGFLLGAIAHPAEAAKPIFSGKLWLVPFAGNVVFPAPSATPDATFTTTTPVFSGQGPSTANPTLRQFFSIGGFLNSVSPVSNLTFSGQVNTYLNGTATANTPISNGVVTPGYIYGKGTYAVLIELTANIMLYNQEYLQIPHDDGLSLAIDGVTIAGFTSSPGGEVDSYVYTGATGFHAVDILYGGDAGPNYLLFTPAP